MANGYYLFNLGSGHTGDILFPVLFSKFEIFYKLSKNNHKEHYHLTSNIKKYGFLYTVTTHRMKILLTYWKNKDIAKYVNA